MEHVEHQLHRALERGGSCTTLLLRPDYSIAFVSKSIHALLGYQPEDLLGTSSIALIHPSDYEPIAAILAEEAVRPTSFEETGSGRLALRTLQLRTASGSWRSVDMSATNLIADESVNGYLIHLFDASVKEARIEAYRALIEDSDPLDALDALAHALSVQMDGAAVLIEADGASNRLEQSDMHRLREARGSQVLCLEDSVTASRKATHICVPVMLDDLEVGCITVEDHTGLGFTSWGTRMATQMAELASKLVARERSKRLLSRAAETDALTGVANRLAFERAINLVHRVDDLGGSWLALFYIDLDGFKSINDQYGHLAGDQVLVVVAQRLQRLVRTGDLVSRLGGDEFCVLAHIPSTEAAASLGNRIARALTIPIEIDELQLVVGATVGIAVTANPQRCGDLVRFADDLLIHTKATNKSTVSLGVIG